MALGFGKIVRLLADNLDELTGGGQGLRGVAYPRVGVTEELPNGVFSRGERRGHAQAWACGGTG